MSDNPYPPTCLENVIIFFSNEDNNFTKKEMEKMEDTICWRPAENDSCRSVIFYQCEHPYYDKDKNFSEKKSVGYRVSGRGCCIN
jgi:hypothetical protein